MHLTHRPRRIRADQFSRNLARQTTLNRHDLIYPVFVCEGSGVQQPIPSMPGIHRWSIDTLADHLQPLVDMGLCAVALFPVIAAEKKDLQASEAINSDGLMPRILADLAQRFPQLGLIADVALDPYTSHGLDGVIDANGYVVNDTTVELLVQQALVQAQAGAQIVAPSDMMDGRVGAIRSALEQNGWVNTRILAYSAKFASSFYGPFRDAVGSASALGKADKYSFQIDPANGRDALREAELDTAEGADILMVKPALPYLDIIANIRACTQLPLFAYQVSGEYAMLAEAIRQGWLPQAAIFESLLAIKRAGADAILSYFTHHILADLP